MCTCFLVPWKPHSLHRCLMTSGPSMISSMACSVAGATHNSCPGFFYWLVRLGRYPDHLYWAVPSAGFLQVVLLLSASGGPVPASVGNPSIVSSGVAPPVTWPCPSIGGGRISSLAIIPDLSGFIVFTGAGSTPSAAWITMSFNSFFTSSFYLKLLVLTQCLTMTCCLLPEGNKINLLGDQRQIASVKSIEACSAGVNTSAAKVTALRM